jgi:hypothetical protein
VKQMEAQAKLMQAQAKMADASIKAQNAQGDLSLKMAQLQTENMKEENEKQKIGIDVMNHEADRRAKVQLESMKLKQSELVHHDKLGHEMNQKLLDVDTQQTLKGLDHMENERQRQFDMARGMEDRQHQTAQSDLDRLNEAMKPRTKGE